MVCLEHILQLNFLQKREKRAFENERRDLRERLCEKEEQVDVLVSEGMMMMMAHRGPIPSHLVPRTAANEFLLV
jgi:hypothetical protein